MQMVINPSLIIDIYRRYNRPLPSLLRFIRSPVLHTACSMAWSASTDLSYLCECVVQDTHWREELHLSCVQQTVYEIWPSQVKFCSYGQLCPSVCLSVGRSVILNLLKILERYTSIDPSSHLLNWHYTYICHDNNDWRIGDGSRLCNAYKNRTRRSMK